MKKLNWLQTPDEIWRPYAFDRVTVISGSKEVVSLLGVCYSPYESGPSLFDLAHAVGEILGPGAYGLRSCRRLGFRYKPEPKIKPAMEQKLVYASIDYVAAEIDFKEVCYVARKENGDLVYRGLLGESPDIDRDAPVIGLDPGAEPVRGGDLYFYAYAVDMDREALLKRIDEYANVALNTQKQKGEGMGRTEIVKTAEDGLTLIGLMKEEIETQDDGSIKM